MGNGDLATGAPFAEQAFGSVRLSWTSPSLASPADAPVAQMTSWTSFPNFCS